MLIIDSDQNKMRFFLFSNAVLETTMSKTMNSAKLREMGLEEVWDLGDMPSAVIPQMVVWVSPAVISQGQICYFC